MVSHESEASINRYNDIYNKIWPLTIKSHYHFPVIGVCLFAVSFLNESLNAGEGPVLLLMFHSILYSSVLLKLPWHKQMKTTNKAHAYCACQRFGKVEGQERVNNISLFFQGKKIVKKVNYIPVKSSRLYCLVFTNFLLKSHPLHSTKASKSASNDIKSLNQAAIKRNSWFVCLFCSKMRANRCFFYSVWLHCNYFSVRFDNDKKKNCPYVINT